MKHWLSISFLSIFCSLALFAQNEPAANAPRVRSAENQENFERLSRDIEDLLAANAALQRRMSAMADEIKQLREEQSKYAKSSSIHDDQKRLFARIDEVDRKRESDRDLVLEQLKQLTKLVAAAPVTAEAGGSAKKEKSQKEAAKSTTEKPTIEQKGFYHTIQKGEMLETVLKDYNAEFKRRNLKQVTLKQVLEANEGLKADKVFAGKKIFIPVPPE